ncbi:EI24 domain-containing protein [uncultured Friedmanniella sp.]|uniref:EI24 domain-containing protein n=1 Tax=uncultured Friedmanniella sp. TaxID=335381 RepID=UPI0035CC7384
MTAPTTAEPIGGAAAELAGGVGLLGRGLGLVARRPRLFLLGALPPLVTSIVFTVVLVVLLTHLDAWLPALTPFAAAWSAGVRSLVELLVGLALVAASVLVMVLTFTTLTLALGAPLYDLISEHVDAELPGRAESPAAEQDRLLRSAGRAVRQSVALIAVSALAAVLLFAAGFLPVVGQTVVPVVSALVGGWLLGIELVGSALERRGVLTLRGRRELMRGRRLRVLGLCVPTFLLLSVPFLGVVVFPVATAAGTLLARQLLGESTVHPGPA